jgi:uncharacterized protein (TIGR03086 family)
MAPQLRTPPTTTKKAAVMEPIEQLSYIVPTFNALVDRIDLDQLNSSTLCTNFTVHGVIDHMIVDAGSFAPLIRGEAVPDVQAPPVYGRVPGAEFRKAMDDLLDAVKTPGAGERTLTTPVGEMPGEAFARFVAFDGLIHCWDLATATDLDWAVPPALISSVDAFARNAISGEVRDGDTFKAEATPPEGASPLECLTAFSGRSV